MRDECVYSHIENTSFLGKT